MVPLPSPKSLWPLWALTFLPPSLSAGWFSGEMRVDSFFKQDITTQTGVLPPELEDDQYHLTRMRLVYNQLFNDNRYYARLAVIYPEDDVFQIKKNAYTQTGLTNIHTLIGEASISVNHQGLVSSYGRIEAPDISDEHDFFQLGIGERIGTTIGRSGYHLGVRANFKQRALGTQVGLWQQTLEQAPTTIIPVAEVVTPSKLEGAQTPTETNLDSQEVAKSITAESYEKHGIRYAWGGRVAYTPYYSPYRAFGMGLGFRSAPLDIPLVMAVLYDKFVAGDSISSEPAQGFYRLLTFSRLQELRFDMLRTFDQFGLRFGSSFQRLPLDQSASVQTSDNSGGEPISVSPESYIFEDTARSFGYYIEGSMLLGGASYQVCRERAVIQGVRVPASWGALEFGVRWGFERYTNALCLMQDNGVQDFLASSYDAGLVSGTGRLAYSLVENGDHQYYLMRVDNEVGDSTEQFISSETVQEYSFFGLGQEKDVVYSYKTYGQGLSFHLNYYFNETTTLQLQFESIHYQKDIISRDNGLVDSLKFQHLTQWQARFESKF